MRNVVGNVLVTGADGFIGKYLVRRLKEEGYTVYTFDVKDGDIADCLLDFPDVKHVFHLAGMTFVPKSWSEPYEFYRTNVLGTANILNFCHKNKCSITIPSTYMYGNPKYLPVDEKHPIDSNASPYHNTKYLSELIAMFYAEKMDVPCTIMRLFNVYGMGQNENFIVPHLIKEVCSDVEEIVVKDIEPKRDYVYIEDVVDALVKSIQKTEERFRIYNVGTGVSYNVLELANVIMEIYGQKKNVVSMNERRPGEIMDTIADVSKIKADLDWTPKYCLVEGIRRMKEL